MNSENFIVFLILVFILFIIVALLSRNTFYERNTDLTLLQHVESETESYKNSILLPKSLEANTKEFSDYPESLYENINKVEPNNQLLYKKCKTEVMNECQIPTLTQDKCFLNKYNECPAYNGSYQQCTNNYIPRPKTENCECDNRTFEMCPKPYKLSPTCYYHKMMNKCDKLRIPNKIQPGVAKIEPINPNIEPRVNIWRQRLPKNAAAFNFFHAPWKQGPILY